MSLASKIALHFRKKYFISSFILNLKLNCKNSIQTKTGQQYKASTTLTVPNTKQPNQNSSDSIQDSTLVTTAVQIQVPQLHPNIKTPIIRDMPQTNYQSTNNIDSPTQKNLFEMSIKDTSNVLIKL